MLSIFFSLCIKITSSINNFLTDHDKEKDQPHIHGFDQAAESLVKKVKQALAEGQGCRVIYMQFL